MNLAGSSGSFQNFYTALYVISDSYFKSSVGSEDEKPTKRDAPELLTQFLSLLENCTSITTVHKLYDHLSCLNFSQSSQSNKRDISCASERKTLEILYNCIDQDDLQYIFNLNNPSTAVDLIVKEKKNCLGFAVDMTGSTVEEISHVEVVKASLPMKKHHYSLLCSVQ